MTKLSTVRFLMETLTTENTEKTLRKFNEMKSTKGGQALWVKIKQQLNNHAERRETI